MDKPDRRKNRSDFYQHLLLEVAYSHDMLESFSTDDSISKRLNPFEYDEQLLELEDQLKIEFWRVVNSLLTEKQKNVIKLYASGLTQMEVAKQLGVNQSSITKSLNGNVDYRNGGNSSYGGSRKKLRRIIETDEKIIEILNKIKAIREEKW